MESTLCRKQKFFKIFTLKNDEKMTNLAKMKKLIFSTLIDSCEVLSAVSLCTRVGLSCHMNGIDSPSETDFVEISRQVRVLRKKANLGQHEKVDFLDSS